MGRSYDIKLDKVAVDVIAKRLSVSKQIVERNARVVSLRFANELAGAAAGGAKRSPSGLWKGAGGARYNVKDRRDGSIGVQTPGGKAGRALAISEFASKNPSGKKLGQTLSSIYGAPGRILWAAYDSREESWIHAVESAVIDSAREIEGGT